ncbi:MAG TPA: hypothetical protein VGO15_01920 [Candidatus Limnocylindrales bacterium]|nr:hypothetical protein [Candidatus Limnocylindrales bacterium]
MNEKQAPLMPFDGSTVEGDQASAPPLTPLVVPVRIVRPERGKDRARIAGALVIGGLAGAAILGPLSAMAASPTPTASGAVSAPVTPAASGAPTTDNDVETGGGRGGHVEATSDTAVVAKAIGITEAQLTAELSAGKTVAVVAAANNVPLQTVIDALVADGKAELDAEVKAGTLTQAQADAEQANVLARATAQANGTFSGKDGHGGRGGHVEATSDASVVAKAIGITEAQLTTELAGGKTVAAVATAHNVPVQTVIDALVADGQAELDAEVKAGTLTQAQADAEKANVLARATAQANGTFDGDGH